MKKLAGIAVMSVLLSTLLQPQHIFAADGFKDLDQTNYKTQIEALKLKGFLHGVNNEEFKPQAELTNAQGIQLIVDSMQLSLAAIDFNKAPEAEGLFSKIRNDAWYAQAFINGYYNGLDIPADIDPQKPMTKEQFTHYLVQALEKTGQFPLIKIFIQIHDEQDITPGYQGTIQRSLIYKFTTLDDQQNFNPKQVMKRDQAAGMVYEAVKFAEDHKNSAIQP
ncbi:S-layer homology domain-containing protein [Paenibacillus sp. HJL G12]|uniref:S-layer homology domain-containing protein n=1 Tax=Paenibacillus dendrobii TaxID=2691084 RepID=A0A7X3LG95_9BACL|nr:S-layer homology domain-containing protein [Paenibacillus dendrobii]MWV42965.1 S-layer homology domain-containing protein [Paenibacillus dendrobii]